nr:helix-hairpin-helix domain-containing protein [Proteus mirabilis]
MSRFSARVLCVKPIQGIKTVPFSEDEKAVLLSVKGVGPKVVERLEQMGIVTLSQLANAEINNILEHGANITGSTCWKNSPQAKNAITSAIQAARSFPLTKTVKKKI